MSTQHGSSRCLPAAAGHCAQHSNRPKPMLGRSEPLHLLPGSHFHLRRLLIQSASNPSDQPSHINGNHATRACSAVLGTGTVQNNATAMDYFITFQYSLKRFNTKAENSYQFYVFKKSTCNSSTCNSSDRSITPVERFTV